MAIEWESIETRTMRVMLMVSASDITRPATVEDLRAAMNALSDEDKDRMCDHCCRFVTRKELDDVTAQLVQLRARQ